MLHADMRRDIQEIFRATPHSKQVMMFSATLSKDIRPVCKKFMQDVIIPAGWVMTTGWPSLSLVVLLILPASWSPWMSSGSPHSSRLAARCLCRCRSSLFWPTINWLFCQWTTCSAHVAVFSTSAACLHSMCHCYPDYHHLYVMSTVWSLILVSSLLFYVYYLIVISHIFSFSF